MSKKKKRRHRPGGPSSQNVAVGQRNRADFEMLIQRKTELYPRNRRLFMGLEVAESAGRLHVNVVSTDLDRMG